MTPRRSLARLFSTPRPAPATPGQEIRLICSGDKEHAAREHHAGHPRHGGDRGGDGLDDALAARPSGALLHLPGEGPAALAYCPALDGGEKGGSVGKTFGCGVHGVLNLFFVLLLRTL